MNLLFVGRIYYRKMLSKVKVGRYFVGKSFVEKKELADEDMKEERMMKIHTYLLKREGMICQFVNELYILRLCTTKVRTSKIKIREP